MAYFFWYGGGVKIKNNLDFFFLDMHVKDSISELL